MSETYSKSNLSSRTSLELHGEGFHRKLFNKIEINIPKDQIDCAYSNFQVALLLKVANTWFVDFDEVKELKRLKVFGSARINGDPMDTEKPAEVSEGQEIVMYLDEYELEEGEEDNITVLYTTVVVPIHARYQKPGIMPFSNAVIEPPTLSLSCLSNRSIFWNKLICDNNLVQDRCEQIFDDTIWFTVPAYEKTPNLIMKIPVGNIEDQLFVHWITTSIVLVATLLISLFAISNRIK